MESSDVVFGTGFGTPVVVGKPRKSIGLGKSLRKHSYPTECRAFSISFIVATRITDTTS
jgi:hypothetical protein